MKKDWFECRGMSSQIAFSGISGPPGIHCLEQNRLFILYLYVLPPQVESFIMGHWRMKSISRYRRMIFKRVYVDILRQPWTISTPTHRKQPIAWIKYTLKNENFSIATSVGKIMPVSNEGVEFWYPDESKLVAFFGTVRLWRSWSKERIFNSPIEKFTPSRRLPVEIFMEELKPLIMGKMRLKVEMNKIEGIFLWKLKIVRTLLELTKPMILEKNYSP